MELSLIATIAVAVLLFGAVSRRLQTTIVTPPMIFAITARVIPLAMARTAV